jgi:hypothetical protein
VDYGGRSKNPLVAHTTIPEPACQMKNDAERKKEVADRLIGAWNLVAWFETKPNGELVYPLGADASGQIMYSLDGHVAAQLACRQPERFRSDDWRQASEIESARAWKQYFGYFGRFSIDLEANAVIHHVEGSWFPNLVNTKQTRHFQFEGSRLVLNADTEWGQVQIVWERMDAAQESA